MVHTKRAAVALILITIISTSAAAMDADTYDTDTDFMSEMISAATQGDFEAGQAAEAARNAKIDEFELDYVKISFEDLSLLSKLIYDEAGSWWLSEEWKLAVGEVALNRVVSPEFPDTLYDVIHQNNGTTWQYSSVAKGYFDSIKPSEEVVRIALRLLEGERYLESSVVFQSGGPQGSGIYKTFYDDIYGYTYLCYSNNMSLYE